ncbi:DNA repair protein RadC [Desulfatibacillum alkenivorans DSM 16219]|jgi:DNA repair protein RadC|uniref:DNA repair protein RadC n=1 Tax=Desulfatibacillum alkenivorans DSM 16219 TaxID=1121393 RepID=A0A1M6TSU3_9BACT|nr:DNA repair protein RadC [Desulfatibacillum alkenivorans]SHK60085.1 DNA repair protein RadC [Desulfatibacillum alkenivorans DSM 16219]
MAKWEQEGSAPETLNEAVPKLRAANPGEGHRGRLRERFLQNGLDGFLDYEVVELLLTLATPRKDCKQQAKAAVNHFGSLKAVLAADKDELQKVKGLGPANILGILLMRAVAKKHLESEAVLASLQEAVSSSEDLYNLLNFQFENKKNECFFIVYLDVRNRILDMETPFEGSLNASHVYTRELIDKALKTGASAVLLAHNHPSGDTKPSKNDIQLTYTLFTAFRSVEIHLLEHLIIGKQGEYYSFADHGYLERFAREYDASRKKFT